MVFFIIISMISLTQSLSTTTMKTVVNNRESLQLLFDRYVKLSPIEKRAVSAIVGSAVADAATRPLHWLYDRKKLEVCQRVIN